MPKPPPKKRPPTLRELLERDAKYPLQNIGITDDFNKSPVENGMSDIQDETTQQELILRAKREYENMQSRKVPTGPPQEFNPNEIPKPISINPLVLLGKILTSAAPAGIRQDTELAMLRDAENKQRKDRERIGFINQVGQGFAPRPVLGRMRELLGVPRK